MQYLVKFLDKDRLWSYSTLSLPDELDPEKYIEKYMAKDFILYIEAVKSKERVRKEELIAKSQFDLLRS
ncbi:MAG: hypothetical protein JHC33_14515 [Ignisphaera sp.]|nr:hypothetical protein [Ignisphaera sp.]